MTCTEFHNVLPYIIDSDPTAEEHAHLDSCPVCSDVVTDLKYIAQIAKFLLTFEEPPARVWHTIRQKLERPATGNGNGHSLAFPRGDNSEFWEAH